MVFDITKSSDWNFRETKEIKTLYDLLTFLKESGTNEIVVGCNRCYPDRSNNEYFIEIYDTWRE